MPVTVGVRSSDARVQTLVRSLLPAAVSDEAGECPVVIVDQGAEAEPNERLQVLATDGGALQKVASFGTAHLENSGTLITTLLSRIAQEIERSRSLEIAWSIEQMLSADDPQSVWDRFVTDVRSVSLAASVSLLFQDPLHDRFAVVSGDPLEQDDTWVPAVPPSAVRAAAGDPAPQRFTWQGSHPALLIPLVRGEDVFGFVRLEWSEDKEPPESVLASAAMMARRATPLLEISRSLARERELAIRDDLTRAYNRRFFDRTLDEEIERARRYHTPFSLIFLDLDDLKLINSRSGHLTGSRVLQEVARRMLGAVRAIDRVVRFGGDEFCILLPQTDCEQTRRVAERVRDAISHEPIVFEETPPIHLTASFGIASYPAHADTHDGLIRAADAAMYAVKQQGKNGVGIAPTG